MLFKYHAACHGVHATIEAARAIQARAHVDPAEIERVDVAVQSEYLNICGIDTPATGLEGKFSLRFCAALALAGADTADVETYSDANVRDPALTALLEKVRIHARPAMPMKVADVTVLTRSGAAIEERFDVGVPDRDLTRQWVKLAAKFRSCAAPVIGEEKTARTIEAVAGLDRAADLSALAAAWA
ncbi:MAG: hypothetical protein RIM80_17570 [Alphaproteobacteria bacterium]